MSGSCGLPLRRHFCKAWRVTQSIVGAVYHHLVQHQEILVITRHSSLVFISGQYQHIEIGVCTAALALRRAE